MFKDTLSNTAFPVEWYKQKVAWENKKAELLYKYLLNQYRSTNLSTLRYITDLLNAMVNRILPHLCSRNQLFKSYIT